MPVFLAGAFFAAVFFAGAFFGERLAVVFAVVVFAAFAAGFLVVAISLAPQVSTPGCDRRLPVGVSKWEADARIGASFVRTRQVESGARADDVAYKDAMHTDYERLQRAIGGDGEHSPADREALSRACAAAQTGSDDELAELFNELARGAPPATGAEGAAWLDRLLVSCVKRLATADALAARDRAPLLPALRDEIGRFYRHLGAECRPRRHLLSMLVQHATADDLALFAELLADDPPLDALDASAPLVALSQQPRVDLAPLFPRLLDATRHSQAASAVLELANMVARRRPTSAHPAAAQAEKFSALLDGVVARLAQLQTQKPTSSAELQKLQSQVTRGVELASALCDTLGLIGDEASSEHALAALHKAMALAHRRIRVEAAAALARLGDDDGARVLTSLAAYPISRLRAIAYARELGLEDHLNPQFTSPEARAEAALATYLAEPLQFGVPPSVLELIDQRTQFWPGYAEPQACFLLRFGYATPQGVYENVGMAGPLVHALTADFSHLPIDDVYAAFAGWQTEHPDIHEVPAEEFSPAHHAAVARIMRRLVDEGFENVTPVLLGSFFGETVLVAIARHAEEFGSVVAGVDEAAWFPRDADTPRPIGPHEAWWIWKGRRILTAFNSRAE